MRNPLASLPSTDLGLLFARVPLGAWLVLSGFAKFTAAGGVDAFVRNAAAAVPAWVPDVLVMQYLRAVPYAEILIGAALVLGIGGRVAGLLASILLGSVVLLVTGWRSAGQPFHPGVVLLGGALLILLCGVGTISMDRIMWNRPAANLESAPRRRGRLASANNF